MYGFTKEELSMILPNVEWAMKEGLLSNKRAIKAYIRVRDKYYDYLSSTLHHDDGNVITDKYIDFKTEEYNAFIKYGFSFIDIHRKYIRYKNEMLDKIYEEKQLKEYIESCEEGTPV